MTAEETRRRRIRAARALADLTVEELADAIDAKGLKAKTLGAIERGEREVRPHELRAIAEACGLPYEFFTADFNILTAPHHGSNLAERMDELEADLKELRRLIPQPVSEEQRVAEAARRSAES
jgi:transcriptional regulator with XRE-family HTH domain